MEPSMTTTHTSPSSTSSHALILIQDGEVNLEKGEKHKFSNLSKNLPPTWSSTGRRSKNSRARIRIPSFEEVHRVANDIIMLSQGKLRVEDLPFKKRRMELPPFEELPNQCEKTVVDYKGKRKTSAFVANSSGHKKQNISGAFICHKCNKSFVSYQALGGHNSHHKKEVDREFNEEFSKSDCLSANKLAQHVSGSWRHNCPTCNKCFQSSHALAGHRRHCKAPIPVTQVAMEEAIDKVIVQVPKRTFLFELNELPSPEDEDEMEDKNKVELKNILRLTWHDLDGYASSSLRTISKQ